MSDTLDKANDAAEGDLDAWKYLAMGLSVIALVGGVAVGAFYTIGQNIGGIVRDTAEDAAETVTDSGSSGGSGGSGIIGGDD